MIVVGLTGSIAMGKSETAKMFSRLGIPVFDADAAVHALYAPGGRAVGPIAAEFPAAMRGGSVDREALARVVLDDAAALARLEAIVHPLVQAEERAFLARSKAAGADLAVLDIPLLLETGAHSRVDRIVVVSAPGEVQRQRALARPGMTPQRLDRILASQLPDAEKRRRADFVVDTSRGLDCAFEQVRRIVHALSNATSRDPDPGCVRSSSTPRRPA